MNRIERLSAILIQLQTKRFIKANEIAHKFNISLRTVYRDVRALEQAGVPIIGEAGIGYQLREGYKLPPVMFTEEEASALLTGAKLMQSMSDEHLWKLYSSALDKIKATLRYADKDYLEEIDGHVAIIAPPSAQHQKTNELHLPKILKAIASASAIEINYTSTGKGETLQRTIEPVGIYYGGNHWYVIAWCRLRSDYRNFRADNITKLTITSEKITNKHPPLQYFINKTAEQQKVQKVVIEVEKEVIKYLGEQKYYNGFVSEEEVENNVRITFLCGSLPGFARWFLLFADHAKIIEPPSLNGLIVEQINCIEKKISLNQTLLT